MVPARRRRLRRVRDRTGPPVGPQAGHPGPCARGRRAVGGADRLADRRRHRPCAGRAARPDHGRRRRSGPLRGPVRPAPGRPGDRHRQCRTPPLAQGTRCRGDHRLHHHPLRGRRRGRRRRHRPGGRRPRRDQHPLAEGPAPGRPAGRRPVRGLPGADPGRRGGRQAGHPVPGRAGRRGADHDRGPDRRRRGHGRGGGDLPAGAGRRGPRPRRGRPHPRQDRPHRDRLTTGLRTALRRFPDIVSTTVEGADGRGAMGGLGIGRRTNRRAVRSGRLAVRSRPAALSWPAASLAGPRARPPRTGSRRPVGP
ncbi:hypothetical protein SGPA1_41159 [Streptomyces misionensis JCM 4497]